MLNQTLSISKRTISIIGGGPSALILAAFLNPDKWDIALFEKNKSLGRKFLVAGKGGFNLTHSEEMAQLKTRYSPSTFLSSSLDQFSNVNFQEWLASIDIPTYVGSSKRIFPIRGIKPITVLNSILGVLKDNSVSIHLGHTWTGWDKADKLMFNEKVSVSSDIVVFALGGASWKVTGSDGSWFNQMKSRGIQMINFQPSNCNFTIQWPVDFVAKHEGSPLKNIALSCGDKTQKGEVVITKNGIEGNGIYALSPEIRLELGSSSESVVYLDLKPNLTPDTLSTKLHSCQEKNISDCLRKNIKVSKAQIDILKLYLTKDEFLDRNILASKIKNIPLKIVGLAPLDEAISTTGGIALSEINSCFELTQLPRHYCIGEMLNWDAPTGGYLLQASASMGVSLARHLNTLT